MDDVMCWCVESSANRAFLTNGEKAGSRRAPLLNRQTRSERAQTYTRPLCGRLSSAILVISALRSPAHIQIAERYCPLVGETLAFQCHGNTKTRLGVSATRP